MTPSEERTLYENDRGRWIQYMAPRLIAQFKGADELTKQTAWAMTSPALKSEIRRLIKLGTR